MALWTPAELTTILWLDAQDSGTITGSAAVSNWADKSGNANDAYQSTADLQPAVDAAINSYQALLFAGDYLIGTSVLFPGTGPFTIFAVYKPNTTGNYPAFAAGSANTVGAYRWIGPYNTDPSFLGYGLIISHPDVKDTTAKIACVTFDSSKLTSIYRNGDLGNTSTLNLKTPGTSPPFWVGHDNLGNLFQGHIGEILVLDYAVDTDTRQLIEGYLAWRWGLEADLPAGHPYISAAPGSASAEVVRMSLEQVFGMSDGLRMILEQSWLMSDMRMVIEQTLQLRERKSLLHAFYDAPTIRKSLYQVYGDAVQLRRVLEQTLSDGVPLRKVLQQVFSSQDNLRLVLEHDFRITADSLRKLIGHNFSLQDVELVRKTLYQILSLVADGQALPSHNKAVTVNGAPISANDMPISINIERDVDIYYISCELELPSQAAWAQFRHGDVVTVTVGSMEYALICTLPSRDRIHRAHGTPAYRVECASPAVQLGHGYAATVEGGLTGFASEIAAQLAPGFFLDWQIVDEYYRPGVLIAAGEYPIEIISNLAAAVGGVIQSQPDGSLKAVPRYTVTVPGRAAYTPDYTLSDAEDVYSAGESLDLRAGYNKYAVSNQATAADTLRQEEEAISKSLKEIRVYQTPWDGTAQLSHTGGDWITITPMGIEGREIEEEIVEFVDGEGQTQYPIYSWSDIEWRANNLGTITFNEDGSLTATVPGDSLLAITYKTKCKLFEVRDAETEQVQLIAEDAS